LRCALRMLALVLPGLPTAPYKPFGGKSRKNGAKGQLPSGFCIRGARSAARL